MLCSGTLHAMGPIRSQSGRLSEEAWNATLELVAHEYRAVRFRHCERSHQRVWSCSHNHGKICFL